MKAFFLFALLALAAASTAFGQFDDVLAQDGLPAHFDLGHHQQCQEEQMMMGSCRDYLMQRCTASSMMPIFRPWKWGMSSCRAWRQRCCQQLEQTPEQCRCKAICRTIQGGLLGSQQQGQMTQVLDKARSLPSMCNMYPSYCNIPSSGQCY